MKEIIKDLLMILKERRLERKAWKRLLSKDMDMRFLVQLINIAEIKEKAVDIKLIDGTLIKVYDPMVGPREPVINPALDNTFLPRISKNPGEGI